MRFLLLWALCIVAGSLPAQSSRFYTRTSSDTILAGQSFQLSFILENIDPQGFIAPDFSPFTLLRGPQMHSSMSLVQSQLTRETHFTYLLRAETPGTWTIPSAQISGSTGPLSSDTKKLVILPNPGYAQPRQGQQPGSAPVTPNDTLRDLLGRQRRSFRL